MEINQMDAKENIVYLDQYGNERVMHRVQIIQGGNDLQEVCHGAAVRAGWWMDTETGEDVRTWPEKYFKLWVGTKIALIHSEASEALEGHRKGLMDDKLTDLSMFEVELADIWIRAADLAGGLGFNLGKTVARKLIFNASRPDHKLENRLKEGGKSY